MSEGFVALKDKEFDWNQEESSESEDNQHSWSKNWDEEPEVNLLAVQEEQIKADDDFPEAVEEKKEEKAPSQIYTPPRYTLKKKTREEKLAEAAESGCPTLFVGNLHNDTTEEDLINFFQQGGDVNVREVRILRKSSHHNRGGPKVFAYVEVETMDDLERGLSAHNNELHRGYKLNVDIAENQQRRYGDRRGGDRRGGDRRGGDRRGGDRRGGDRRGGDRDQRSGYQGRYDPNFGPSNRRERQIPSERPSLSNQPQEAPVVNEEKIIKQREEIFGGAAPVVPKYRSFKPTSTKKNVRNTGKESTTGGDSWRSSKQSKQPRSNSSAFSLRGGKKAVGNRKNTRPQKQQEKREQVKEPEQQADYNNLYAILSEE